MKKFLSIVCGLLSLCLSDVARAETFKVEEFFLDNGLQVVVIENHKAPIVQQMLFYKTGAVDEKIGQGGIAHLLEHLMFRGTAKVKGQQFNRVLEENGAESNAFTSQDVTAYHQLVDISRLELAMFLEADRMQGLMISDDDFATERDIVFQERKQRVDNNPAAKFFEQVRKILWQNHPYGQPVTGQDREIMDLTKKEALSFYNMYYAPNNAVLILSGDIDVITAKNLAQKYYGNLKRMKTPETSFSELFDGYKARVEMALPDVQLGRLVKIWAAPSFNYKPEQVYPLDVWNEYLSGDENSPLYQKLVIKDKSALSVNTSYDAAARSYGNFVLSAVPTKENDVAFEKAIERAWLYALKQFDEEKLAQVKQKMLADLVYLKDNPTSLAQVAGYMAATGVDLKHLRNYADYIEAVTLEQVKQAAEDLWNNAPQVTGVLYPEEAKK